MERIKREVREIESSLHSSRQLLYSLERSAQRSITSGVDGIRTSLKKADHKIESVSSQIHAFRAQIEDVANAEVSVNMESQMTWLHNNLARIIEDLEQAESSARTAIECTDTYVYKVMDLKQDVEAHGSKLVEHHDDAAILLAHAKAEVSASERGLLSIQEKVSAKERAIKSKNVIATSKKQARAVLERQCIAKRNDIAEAQRQRERRKDQAAASTGLAILGVVAAPFTLGTSLALTGAGVAGATYKASRADDFRTEANNLQTSVNTLTREISANDDAVASLEQERSALQVQLISYKDDVSEKQAELRELERQAGTTRQTKQEITSLQNHAASTTRSAKDALPELQSIKNSLEECSVLVQEKSVQVSTSYCLTEQIVGLLPVFGNDLRRTRTFRRQMSALEQVCDTLNQIHLDAPKLLPSHATKFLDIKPWNSYVSGIEAASTMPAMCLY